jgi:hypothetical protein
MTAAEMTDDPYQVVRVDISSEIRPDRPIQEALNRMAARGYEFVQAVPETHVGNMTKVLLIFQRRRQ